MGETFRERLKRPAKTKKEKLMVFILAVFVLSMIGALLSEDYIPHRTLNERVWKSGKYNADIEVYKEDGSLPTAEEMQKIAKKYKKDHSESKNFFIDFYLPGMKIGSGSYAGASHVPGLTNNPDMNVKVFWELKQ